MGNTDNMRVLAVLSTQLTHGSFVAGNGWGRADRTLARPEVAVDLLTTSRGHAMTTRRTTPFGPPAWR